jgi:hypothetical protein
MAKFRLSTLEGVQGKEENSPHSLSLNFSNTMKVSFVVPGQGLPNFRVV